MSVDLSELAWRARAYAALGEPLRLAMVDALVLGDASPGELGRHLGLPTNLVAHHLRILEEAGLVARARSEGDRRRTYLRLRSATLDALSWGRAGSAAPGPAVGGSAAPGARVVFVCTHNSARSQLAAALWRQRTGRAVASAGTQPAQRVHPRAVKVARRHGLVLDPAATAQLDEVVSSGDVVVAVCDNAYEELAGADLTVRPWLHWSVPDPVRVDTDAAFEAAYDELAGRVDRLAPAMAVGDRDDR